MPQYTLPILAAFVGGIIAATIGQFSIYINHFLGKINSNDFLPTLDSHSNDLSSTDDKTNEILVRFQSSPDCIVTPETETTLNFTQPSHHYRHYPDWGGLPSSLNTTCRDMRFSLNDFVECTEMDMLMFVKYDGVSSCVTSHSDEACSEEVDLDPNTIYGIGFYRDVIVCNNARHEDADVLLSIINFIFIVVCIIIVGLVLTICVKCAQMCEMMQILKCNNQNRQYKRRIFADYLFHQVFQLFYTRQQLDGTNNFGGCIKKDSFKHSARDTAVATSVV